jgi:hypothetical protein
MRAAIGLFTKLDAGVEIATGSVTKSPKNPLFEQTEPWESTNGGSINVRLQIRDAFRYLLLFKLLKLLTASFAYRTVIPTSSMTANRFSCGTVFVPEVAAIRS